MSSHALQKRVRRLFSSRLKPSSSPSGQPCAAATGASELSDKVQGRLHRAAPRRHLAWLRRWRWHFKRVGIDPRDQQRRTFLHLASANGRADVIRHLAGKNCQLNLLDDLKRTPLMEAVQCQQEECVAVLLEHGADPNLADADGNTALHLAVLSGNTTVAGLLLEHNASSDAQNQEGYTPLNLAVSTQHEEMLECLLKKAAEKHAAEKCERTSLAVTTSNAADVEKDNLHLQEELERVEMELWEIKEKYLQSERRVQNLMAALDDKDREELAAVQELQDQLSAYLENQTTVKRLEEHVQCLEIENTRLEATVQQQSDRIEALQRDLQASASLREIKEKYLQSECRVQNLMAALDDKDREELAAVQELQDQLSAYLENQTTVKGLEEHVQCLEIENTRLEATVQQQSDRIEALQRDLQASASLREIKEKYLQSERCVQNLMAALDDKDREELAAVQELQDQLSAYLENQTTVKGLEEHVQRLEIENTRLEATVQQQSDRIEALQRDLQASASLQEVKEKYLNSECRVQNLMAALDEKERETTTSALKLQEELSVYLESVKQLEEHMQRLGFEKTSLEATVQQQSNMIEVLQRDLQAAPSAQAASQDRLEHIRASHHDSLTNQLKDRIRDLECELDKIKDTQYFFQKQCTQVEVEKYKELYLKEVNISKCLAKKLERANERLEEANAKLLRERRKSKSLITRSIVSGGLAATPVLYSTALGHLGNSLGLDRSLSLGGSFLRQCEKILLSRKRLAASVAKVQQELDEKITKELKEATAELETGRAGSSKKFLLDQHPLCRAIEYHDVLTKNYII